MRSFVRADLDLWEASDPEIRIERIRELVDELPETQQLVVSRLFFGGVIPTFTDLAEELGLSAYKIKEALDEALVRLREALLEDYAVGAVSADDDAHIRSVLGSLALDGVGDPS